MIKFNLNNIPNIHLVSLSIIGVYKNKKAGQNVTFSGLVTAMKKIMTALHLPNVSKNTTSSKINNYKS